MFARTLGAVGRLLIAAGVLVLLFVAYELWGTNLQEASAQHALARQFDDVLTKDHAPTTTSSTTAPSTGAPSTALAPTVTTPPVTAPANLPLPRTGDPVARIKIPKIGVDKTVVQDVSLSQLKRGPGHYPETPLPGQKGNVGIAGHRTTYGAPFHNIDKLANGDEIVLTTVQGTFTYKVDSTVIVAPSATDVLNDKGDNRVTLTACHPKYSARQRIIVSGVLVGQPVPPLEGQAEQAHRRTLAGKGDEIRIDGGLDGRKPSRTPAFVWAAICALVFLVAWLASRLVRRRTERRLLPWVPYVVATPLFLVVLYVFFENFARLLPSNF